MTTLQLNADFFRQLSIIAEDEILSTRLMKYIKKLTSAKVDPTLMTKEDFFSRVEEAKKGPTYSMLSDEDLTTFLRRIVFPYRR